MHLRSLIHLIKIVPSRINGPNDSVYWSHGAFVFSTQHTGEFQWLEHLWLVYHGFFKLVLESLGKIFHSCRHYYISDNSVRFSFFILIMTSYVYSLESLL